MQTRPKTDFLANGFAELDTSSDELSRHFPNSLPESLESNARDVLSQVSHYRTETLSAKKQWKEKYKKWSQSAEQKLPASLSFLASLEDLHVGSVSEKNVESYVEILQIFVESGIKHRKYAQSLMLHFMDFFHRKTMNLFKSNFLFIFEYLAKLCAENLVDDFEKIIWMIREAGDLFERYPLRETKNLAIVMTHILTLRKDIAVDHEKNSLYQEALKTLSNKLCKAICADRSPAESKPHRALIESLPEDEIHFFRRNFFKKFGNINPFKLSLKTLDSRAEHKKELDFANVIASIFCFDSTELNVRNYWEFGDPEGVLLNDQQEQFEQYLTPQFSVASLEEEKPRLIFHPQNPSSFCSREVAVGSFSYDVLLQAQHADSKIYRFFFEFNGIVFHYVFDMDKGKKLALNAASLVKQKKIDLLDPEYRHSVNICIQISQLDWDELLSKTQKDKYNYRKKIVEFFISKIPEEHPHAKELAEVLTAMSKNKPFRPKKMDRELLVRSPFENVLPPKVDEEKIKLEQVLRAKALEDKLAADERRAEKEKIKNEAELRAKALASLRRPPCPPSLSLPLENDSSPLFSLDDQVVDRETKNATPVSFNPAAASLLPRAETPRNSENPPILVSFPPLSSSVISVFSSKRIFSKMRASSDEEPAAKRLRSA